MGGIIGGIRYFIFTPLTKTGAKNMYIYGGSVLSFLTLIVGMATVGTMEGAIEVWLEFYVMRLVPWPLDEAVLADTLRDLVISHLITILVGQSIATSRWVANN